MCWLDTLVRDGGDGGDTGTGMKEEENKYVKHQKHSAGGGVKGRRAGRAVWEGTAQLGTLMRR